jgi:hypothetical protein
MAPALPRCWEQKDSWEPWELSACAAGVHVRDLNSLDDARLIFNVAGGWLLALSSMVLTIYEPFKHP